MAKRYEDTPYIRLNQKISSMADEWNSLKPREKRNLIANDPQRAEKLRDKLYQGGFIKEGKEIISLENKRRGLKGQELRQANKLHHENRYNEVTLAKERSWFAKVKRLYEEKIANRPLKEKAKKLGKTIKKMGLSDRVKSPNQLMINGLPNADIIKLGKKNYEKLRSQMNDIAGKYSLKPHELKVDIDKKWDKAVAEVEKISKADDAEQLIKQNIIDYNREFMEEHYFLNADNIRQEQRIINEYMKHLDVDKLYEIKNLLTDETFLGIYSSDQESETYTKEFIEKRQHKLIDILRNETGKIIRTNPENPRGDLIVEDSNSRKLDDLTFAKFIGSN